MGDVAMTVPILRQFTKQYPSVRLTVLTKSFFAPFFRDIENVSVHAVDVKGKHKGILGLYKLSKELKKLKFDAIADLHNVLRSKMLKLFLINKKCIQIDKGRAEKKALIKGKLFKQLTTTHQRYAEVFDKLGYPLDLSTPVFSEAADITDKLKEVTGNKNKPWIGIAPFAAFKSKTYSLSLMQEVITSLSKTNSILLFGGGKNEIKALETIANSNINIINLAGKLSLDEELDVISNLDLMISMDSGNAHIAAMFGVEVITLWGVTHPYAGFYPFNQNPENALLANRDKFPLIPTSIYGKTFPEGYEDAINSISPQQIISKATSMLQKSLT
ncbi:glycosyltransferase family 9 protein [Pontimicrobium aquaticum]|uniref:Glycosyltransferase family 9 protein n=2 Tax=Pontimicrobium aquaticum TaxID=2565367 RepID=A0A4U0ESS9_9FLAO|nr:glycosyltransferase family 9 protein [Pontimicrobium aquaticum]